MKNDTVRDVPLGWMMRLGPESKVSPQRKLSHCRGSSFPPPAQFATSIIFLLLSDRDTETFSISLCSYILFPTTVVSLGYTLSVTLFLGSLLCSQHAHSNPTHVCATVGNT